MTDERTTAEYETGPLWLAAGLAAPALIAWACRERVHDWTTVHRITAGGGWHLTTAGQIVVGALILGLLAAGACAASAAAWVRWHRAGGAGPVPAVPLAPAIIAAVVAAATVLVIAGEQRLGVQAAALAAALVTGAAGGIAGRRYRQAAIFGQSVADLLGWAEPAPGRIRAERWRSSEPDLDGHAGPLVPGRIRIAVGPGFRPTPGLWSELNRRAADLGWTRVYVWRFDPADRTVTGTAG